jgi:phospholipase D1/2
LTQPKLMVLLVLAKPRRVHPRRIAPSTRNAEIGKTTVKSNESAPRTLRDALRGKAFWRLAAGLALFVALAALWRFTSLAEWLDPERLAALIAPIRGTLWAPVAVLVAYVVAGILVMPATFLMVLAGLLFDPWAAILYSLVGSLASALATYGLGAVLWQDALERLAGDRLAGLRSRLTGGGGLGVVLFVRVVPVAPYSVINYVAGSVRLNLRDYVLGTAIGLTPTIIGLTLFADRLAVALKNPSARQLGLAAAVLVVVVVLSLALRYVVVRRGGSAS